MLSLRALGNLGNQGAAARAVSSYFKDNYADYFVKGLDEPYVGVWVGNGTQRLGLEGFVERDVLQLALAGTISGRRVQNAGSPSRQMGWDLTFSAPKSVSVLWAFAEESHREDIQKAHTEAARIAFNYLQEKVTTRRGKGGHIKETPQLALAHFLHFTSRKGDPQLHSHLVIPNFCIRLDGTVGTIESKLFYTHKMTAGVLYQARLALSMRGLGYEIEPAPKETFRVKAVPMGMERAFSKRDIEIDRRVEELGIKFYAGTRGVVLATRPNKTYTTIEEREKAWHQEVEKLGLSVNFKRESHSVVKKEGLGIIGFQGIRDELTKNKSTFLENDIIRHLAVAYMGKTTINDIRTRIYEHFSCDTAVRLLGKDKQGQLVFTTRDMIYMEREILDFAMELVNAKHLKVNPSPVIEKYPFLNAEQINSIQTACGTTGLAIIQGRAGTGKTTVLQAINEVFEKKHISVNGIAFTGQAAQQMQERGDIESRTIHSWLNQKEFKKDSVLIVDEAGMIGTKLMHGVLEKAVQNNMKVIMVGDERQLQPIEAGGPFHMIDRYLLEHSPENSSQINIIKRQKQEWMRAAVTQAFLGNTKEAIQTINDHGKIHVYQNVQEAREDLVQDYLRQYAGHQEKAVILTNRRFDANIINREIREQLKEQGRIDSQGITFNNGTTNIELAEGDRVIFNRNDYHLDVRNGQRGIVQDVSPNNYSVSIKLDQGENKTFKLEDYKHLDYGWASTTHKAQGTTVESTFVFGYSKEPMASKQATYVQISRASDQTLLYVIGGEPSIEIRVDREDRQMDFVQTAQVIKEIQRGWGRDASKYTAVITKAQLEDELAKHIGRDYGLGLGG